MEEKTQLMQSFYDNPATRLNGRDRFYYYLKDNHPDMHITQSEVMAFLKSQRGHQLHQTVPSRKTVKPIVVRRPNAYWQADIVVMRDRDKPGPLPHANKGFHYILTIIDVFSKYAWALPVKRLGNTYEVFRDHLASIDSNQRPTVLQTDNGEEFTSGVFQNVLREYKIKHTTSKSHTPQSQGIIERFNGTIKRAIGLHFTEKSTKRYIDVLQDLVDAYNSARHRSTGQAPKDIAKNTVESAEQIQSAKRKLNTRKNRLLATTNGRIPNIKPGDKVRIALSAIDPKMRQAKLTGIGKLSKSYIPQWTDTIYTVEKRIGSRYQLRSSNSLQLSGTYLSSELQLALTFL